MFLGGGGQARHNELKMLNRKTVNAIKKAYSDIKDSNSAFSSKRNVLREVRKTVKSATLKDIEYYLQGVESYTLHKQSKKRFRTRKFISQGLKYQYQADLIILSSKYSRLNKCKYILCCIDSFSRKLQCAALRRKSNTEIIKKFSIFFKKEGKPKSLYTDAGTEFTGNKFQEFLKQKNIRSYIAQNPWHAGIIERCQKSLKNRIFKYLTHNNTNIFVPKLQEFVRAYNHTHHRALPGNMSPVDVKKSNEYLVWKFQYSSILRRAGTPTLEVGQLVRITRKPEFFRKGYETRFTKEKFVITQAIPSIPPTYKIKSKTKEDDIQGLFYLEELQPVR